MKNKSKTNRNISSMEILRAQGIDVDPLIEGYAAKDVIIRTAKQIRAMRKNSGLSQTELAKIVGMSQADISRIESGLGKKGPGIETIYRLASACNYEFNLHLDPVATRSSYPSKTHDDNADKFRVAVFAEGEQAQAATEAGADIVGFNDLAESIKGGYREFDIVIATLDAMTVVGSLRKILGPLGLMPNIRTGTITSNVYVAVKEVRNKYANVGTLKRERAVAMAASPAVEDDRNPSVGAGRDSSVETGKENTKRR